MFRTYVFDKVCELVQASLRNCTILNNENTKRKNIVLCSIMKYKKILNMFVRNISLNVQLTFALSVIDLLGFVLCQRSDVFINCKNKIELDQTKNEKYFRHL